MSPPSASAAFRKPVPEPIPDEFRTDSKTGKGEMSKRMR